MGSKVFTAKFTLLVLLAATEPAQGTMTDMHASAADVGKCSGDQDQCGADSFDDNFDATNLLQVNMVVSSRKSSRSDDSLSEDVQGKVEGKEAEAEVEVSEASVEISVGADREANVLKVKDMHFKNDGRIVKVIDPNGVEHVHAGSILEKVTSKDNRAVQLTGDAIIDLPTIFTGKELLEAGVQLLSFKAFPSGGMCPEGHYVEVIGHKPGGCKPCTPHCKMCSGPTAAECLACIEPFAVFLVHQDGHPVFQCISECPECYPKKSPPGVCSKDRDCLASKKITKEQTMAQVAEIEAKDAKKDSSTEAPSEPAASTPPPKGGAPGSGMWPFLLSACLGIAVACL